MSWVVVNDVTLEILHIYDAPSNPWIHEGRQLPLLSVPVDIEPHTVMAVRDVDDNIILVADPAKVEILVGQAWANLRIQRNQLLEACDWTRIDDNGLSDEKRSTWAAYRQELRALPSNTQDPRQVVLPQPPV